MWTLKAERDSAWLAFLNWYVTVWVLQKQTMTSHSVGKVLIRAQGVSEIRRRDKHSYDVDPWPILHGARERNQVIPLASIDSPLTSLDS